MKLRFFDCKKFRLCLLDRLHLTDRLLALPYCCVALCKIAWYSGEQLKSAVTCARVSETCQQYCLSTRSGRLIIAANTNLHLLDCWRAISQLAANDATSCDSLRPKSVDGLQLRAAGRILSPAPRYQWRWPATCHDHPASPKNNRLCACLSIHKSCDHGKSPPYLPFDAPKTEIAPRTSARPPTRIFTHHACIARSAMRNASMV